MSSHPSRDQSFFQSNDYAMYGYSNQGDGASQDPFLDPEPHPSFVTDPNWGLPGSLGEDLLDNIPSSYPPVIDPALTGHTTTPMLLPAFQPTPMPPTTAAENNHQAPTLAAAPENRKIRCSYCGLMSTCSFNHDQHVRTHTGEKPHACQICHKPFPRAWSVSRHMHAVHGIDVSTRKRKEDKRKKENLEAQNPTQMAQPTVQQPLPTFFPPSSPAATSQAFGSPFYASPGSSYGSPTDTPMTDYTPAPGNSAIPGTSAYDASIWSTLGPRCNAESYTAFQCSECSAPLFPSAEELQIHRHTYHAVPSSSACACQHCVSLYRHN